MRTFAIRLAILGVLASVSNADDGPIKGTLNKLGSSIRQANPWGDKSASTATAANYRASDDADLVVPAPPKVVKASAQMPDASIPTASTTPMAPAQVVNPGGTSSSQTIGTPAPIPNQAPASGQPTTQKGPINRMIGGIFDQKKPPAATKPITNQAEQPAQPQVNVNENRDGLLMPRNRSEPGQDIRAGQPYDTPQSAQSMTRRYEEHLTHYNRECQCDCIPREQSVFFDVIYWTTNDIKDTGELLTATVTPLQGGTPQSNTFRTGNINTDNEFGFRAGIRRPIDSINTLEMQGFSLHSYRYPLVVASGATASAVTTIAFPPNNAVAIDAVNVLYKYHLWGIELNDRICLLSQRRVLLEGIVGLRYMQDDEQFGMMFDDDNTLQRNDERIRTQNDIFCPQIGFEGQYRLADYVIGRFGAKGMIGANFQEKSIRNSGPTNRITSELSQGFSERTEFTGGAEMTVGVRWRILPNFTIDTGMDFLWINDVLRAPNQLLLVGNQAQGITSNTELWVYGASLRAEYRY